MPMMHSNMTMPMMQSNMTMNKGQNKMNVTASNQKNATQKSDGIKLTQTLALLIASASLSCASLY